MTPVALSEPRSRSRRRLVAVAGFLLLAPGLVFGALFARVQCFPERKPIKDTPAKFGIKFETLEFTGPDGVRTHGWYMPPAKSPAPAVIAIHGHKGRRDAFLDQAVFLHRAGYGVAMLDLRHHGESEDAVCTFGVKEAEEVRPYIEYVKARAEHAGQKLGVIGWSMGAVTALKTASLYKEIDAVVADSPFASLWDQSHWRVSRLVPAAVKDYCWVFAIGSGCLFSGLAPSAWEVTAWLPAIQPRPIFFIHGLADDNIPHTATEQLVAAARPEGVEVWYPKGMRHVEARNKMAVEYAQRVTAFFQRALAQAPQGHTEH